MSKYSDNSDVDSGNAQGPAAGTGSETDTNKPGNTFIMKDGEMRGSLKIYIKLDLEADIRVIAKVKGDIAIGLL